MPLIDSGNEERNEARTGEPLESPELREELIEIGVILNLPSQRPKRATAQMQAIAPQPINFSKLRAFAATFVVVVGFAISVYSLRKPPAPYVPDLLLGEWTTNNPRYDGRQLAFTETSIELGLQKDATRLRYPITSLSVKTLSDTMVIKLAYDDDGGSVELHARLITRGAPKLVFDRPTDLVWERRTYNGNRN